MLQPEDGQAAWLRYGRLPSEIRTADNSPKVETVVVLSADENSPVTVAARELSAGFQNILDQIVTLVTAIDSTAWISLSSPAIVVGTLKAYQNAGGSVEENGNGVSVLHKEDGFWLDTRSDNLHYVLGQNERGAIYGAFEYLSRLAQGTIARATFGSSPSAPIRWINQWDNLDGSIERGYCGPSIFFTQGRVVNDMTRASQYARLMASVGLNGIVINNVNANPTLLSPDNLRGVRRIADAMRPYGVRIGLALNFDAPRELGGLPTSDPLDPDVVRWWEATTARVYEQVPDMLGYTIKANSEGQPGPLSYGRTLAEGANMFARALKSHGHTTDSDGDGLVMYRAFVYNHHLDESDPKNDRANAAVEFFKHLDDEFDDNVVVQIKFGPIDFQVREPPSPLLAQLRRTKAVIELQVAQEYLGQQSHAVYIAPLWKTILDFDLRADGRSSLVRDIVSGERFGWPLTGYTAVVNVGSDPTWLGHHLAMSNLYAYGRLAWRPTDDARDILQDWVRLTFGTDALVVRTITQLMMESWPAYEGHSGNLGIQTLCDILYTHYGPSPASQDGNGWGQWTRADAQGIGMDRTVKTGTGNAGQYPPEVAAVFENINTTPDDLLLWFHHVPYTHRLRFSGKTVIQHFYDAHYEGAATVQTFPQMWETLRGRIDDARFSHVAFKLAYQAGHSLVWRDMVNRFYHSLSGIPDEHGRVGHHKWRIPAASPDMRLDGYEVVAVTPPEAASDGKAVQTVATDKPGTATTTLTFPSGTYDIAVNYYDVLGGQARYELLLNGTSVGMWAGDLEDTLMHDFSELLDGHSATRITFRGIAIKEGDVLSIVGHPDGTERAPLDYVSVLPQGVVD